MRHLTNPVALGMLIGLSLTAISVLTALYLNLWQAISVLLLLCGIFSSASLYFGGCARCAGKQIQQRR